MNAIDFIKTFGRDEAERVAIAAGSNWDYLKQLASGNRNPSWGLAEALSEASGGRMGGK